MAVLTILVYRIYAIMQGSIWFPRRPMTGSMHAEAGIVVSAFTGCLTGDTACNSGFGNTIILDHGSGIFTQYSHLKPASVLVTASATVTKGQKIAEVGATGNVTGAHLHFEVKNHGGLKDSTDTFFAYTDTHPVNYGYLDPWEHISSTKITPVAVEVNNAAGLYVRRGPGVQYSAFTEVGDSQRFVAFAKVMQGGDVWYRIHLPCQNDKTCAGWIAGTYQGVEYAAEVPQAGRVQVTGTGELGLLVRAAPGGTILDKVYDKQQFVITANTGLAGNGCTSNWYEIYTPLSAGASTGWLCGDFVQLLSGGSGGDITGGWAGDVNVPTIGAVPLTMSLTQTGESVTGNYGGASSGTLSGALVNDAFTFTLLDASCPASGFAGSATFIGDQIIINNIDGIFCDVPLGGITGVLNRQCITEGTISGVVSDAQNGALLGGVTVSVSGGASILSGADGTYSFGVMPPGNYQVTVNHGTYTPYSQQVTVCGDATLNISLSAQSMIDTDGDGMPDSYELDNGFDPNDPTDAASRS